ncbi:hypothetical protein MRX96_029395 [Rhipicephalus microplus]
MDLTWRPRMPVLSWSLAGVPPLATFFRLRSASIAALAAGVASGSRGGLSEPAEALGTSFAGDCIIEEFLDITFDVTFDVAVEATFDVTFDGAAEDAFEIAESAIVVNAVFSRTDVACAVEVRCEPPPWDLRQKRHW